MCANWSDYSIKQPLSVDSNPADGVPTVNELCCRLSCLKATVRLLPLEQWRPSEGMTVLILFPWSQMHCAPQTALTVLAEYIILHFPPFILQSSVLCKHLLISCFCCVIFIGMIVFLVVCVCEVICSCGIGRALLSNIPTKLKHPGRITKWKQS